MSFPKSFALTTKIIILVVVHVIISGCASMERSYDYTQKEGPRFVVGNIVKTHSSQADHLKVVSYNIKFSERIDEAIELLQSQSELKAADFIFLQEMDIVGVERIATTLGYNYVYYPTSKHPYHEKDFGNAILSKWPLTNDEKIIFGHSSYVSRQRVTVRARASVNGRSVDLYNVHMHVKIKPHERAKRLNRLIEKSREGADYCIIAGDFNTYWPRESRAVQDVFIQNNFVWANSEVDWTFKHWVFLNKAYFLDYIFARSFEVMEAGAVEDQSASDHIPTWAHLKF